MKLTMVLAGESKMPLLDYFRPPLSQRRHWDSFHGAWAEAMATFAEEETTASSEQGGIATWAPPRPVATVPLDFQDPDIFEVQVLSEEQGPRLVAAVELGSPANKDRPVDLEATYEAACLARRIAP